MVTLVDQVATFTPPDYSGYALHPLCDLKLEITYPDASKTTHVL